MMLAVAALRRCCYVNVLILVGFTTANSSLSKVDMCTLPPRAPKDRGTMFGGAVIVTVALGGESGPAESGE